MNQRNVGSWVTRLLTPNVVKCVQEAIYILFVSGFIFHRLAQRTNLVTDFDSESLKRCNHALICLLF